MWRPLLFMAVAVVVVGVSADEAAAQGGNYARRSFLKYTTNRPNVSPYLNLLQPNSVGSVPNYQTLVRPALEQQRRNQETQRQISQLQVSVAENTVRDQRGEAYYRPTGHQTSFFYYSHYFPTMPQAQPRRR